MYDKREVFKMKQKFLMYLSMTMVLIMVAGCGQSSQNLGLQAGTLKTVTYEEIETVAEDKGEASNQLGISFIQEAYRNKPSENQVFSPISVSFALAMLHNGALGETREGILKALGSDDTELNETYQNLLSYLSHFSSDKDDKKIKTQLMFGNSLWVREGIKAEEAFTDTLKTYYSAELFTEDFASAQTIKKMNTWISHQTNGMLKEAIKELDEMAVALLMNTVYFKGTWLQEFSEASTQKEAFTPEQAESYLVDMMQDTSHRAYYEDAMIQATRLPYYDDLSMTIILPKEDLGTYLEGLEDGELQQLLSEGLTNSQRVVLKMPKVDYEVKNELNDFLIQRGMIKAFDAYEADFSQLARIEGENVFVSRVFQNARIIIDEKGTEAAAVTVVEMETTSAMEPETPVELICNRPYLYVIQEDLTGTILFIGYVVAP